MDCHPAAGRTGRYGRPVKQALLAFPMALLVAYGPSPAATTTDTTASTTAAAADRTLFGFTPFPTHEGIEGVVSSYEIVIDRGDLMAHHFDTCIRWQAFESGSPLPQTVVDQLTLRRSQTPGDMPVYLAVSLSESSWRSAASWVTNSPARTPSVIL